MRHEWKPARELLGGPRDGDPCRDRSEGDDDRIAEHGDKQGIGPKDCGYSTGNEYRTTKKDHPFRRVNLVRVVGQNFGCDEADRSSENDTDCSGQNSLRSFVHDALIVERPPPAIQAACHISADADTLNLTRRSCDMRELERLCGWNRRIVVDSPEEH